MSSLPSLVRRLVTALFAPVSAPADPDAMSLRDWADLPAHHPRS